MGRPLDEDIIIKILERWQKAFKENSHYVSASDLSLVIKDVRELPTIQSVATDTNVGDTISRQQVIDVLKQFKPEIIPYDKARIYVEETVETMYDRIVELPSIQPEQCGDKSYTLWKESYEELKRRMDELTSCSDIISRQAAIDEIKSVYEWHDTVTMERLVEHFNNLPSVQPVATDTNVGDTISRQAAIEKVRAMQTYKLFMGDDMILIDKAEVQTELMMLPSAQPERAKGEWSDGYRWQRCSLCKQTGKKSWNYCPNCGADMRGEKDERTD